MEFKDYQEKALRTESVPARINFGTVGLHAALSLAIQASLMANEVKRAIFYNKPLNNEIFLPIVNSIMQVGQFIGGHAEAGNISQRDDVTAFSQDESWPEHLKGLSLEHVNIRLLHAGLGMFTESGETLQALAAQLEGKPLDVVNFSEELGDIEWYKAVAMNVIELDEGVMRQKNIDKLAKRYPEKFFDANAAVNRDVVGERAILEAAATPKTFEAVAQHEGVV